VAALDLVNVGKVDGNILIERIELTRLLEDFLCRTEGLGLVRLFSHDDPKAVGGKKVLFVAPQHTVIVLVARLPVLFSLILLVGPLGRLEHDLQV